MGAEVTIVLDDVEVDDASWYRTWRVCRVCDIDMKVGTIHAGTNGDSSIPHYGSWDIPPSLQFGCREARV